MIKTVGRNWVYDDSNERIGETLGNVLGNVISAGVARQKDGDYQGHNVGLKNGYLTDKEAYEAGFGQDAAVDNPLNGLSDKTMSATNDAMDKASADAADNNKFVYYSKLNSDALHDASSRMINDQNQGTKFDYNNYTSPFTYKLKQNTEGVSSSDTFDGTDLKKNFLKASSRLANSSYNNSGYTPYNNPFLK